MILTYVCTEKCFFNGGIRKPGDRLVLDQRAGDSCPHLTRAGEEHQLTGMQAYDGKENEALSGVPKAPGKAVSRISGDSKKKNANGGKTE